LFAANIEIIYRIASLGCDYFFHYLPSQKGLYNPSQGKINEKSQPQGVISQERMESVIYSEEAGGSD